MGQRLQEGWGRSTVQETAGRETEREREGGGIERKGESEDEESSGRKGVSFPSVCTCGGSTPSRPWHIRMTRIKPRGSIRERTLRDREFPPSPIDRSAADRRLQLIDASADSIRPASLLLGGDGELQSSTCVCRLSDSIRRLMMMRRRESGVKGCAREEIAISQSSRAQSAAH